jgi:hypothetical protein
MRSTVAISSSWRWNEIGKIGAKLIGTWVLFREMPLKMWDVWPPYAGRRRRLGGRWGKQGVMKCTVDAVECRFYGDGNFEFCNGTLSDDSDYVAKKALSTFWSALLARELKEYGIHLSVNDVANMYDVREYSHCPVLVSRDSPFCTSCILVWAQWYKKNRKHTLLAE